MKIQPAMFSLLAALSLLVGWESSPAFAQNIVRAPRITVTPQIPHIDPVIPGRVVPAISGSNIRVRPSCSADCSRQSVVSNNRGSRNGDKTGSNNAPATSLAALAVANEIVAEIDGALSEAQVDALARRHGLRRLKSENFELIGATIGLFRIASRKTAEAASREFAGDGNVRSVQPNFRYALQDQNAELSEGDPAQYALAKLRLPQAHTLAHGANVRIAVIDSGVDLKHPEFSGAAITPFDALDSQQGPHAHGTGIAGAIVSHARLMGSAPAAHILAIRTFGASGKGVETTSYVVLKALDIAASHGAQIVNMSFAGPKDALIGRGLAALAARNVVLVAAAGNAGPKSPPLYPAADATVIAVSATDAQDKLFVASSRGPHIALSAPGVDIFLPAPDDKYQVTSGTSFSAAYVSGLVALMLERNPGLKVEEIRAILTRTARDLGPPGADEQFGAGEADAFAAVSAVSIPIARSASPETLPAATMAEDKAASSEIRPNAGQTRPETP